MHLYMVAGSAEVGAAGNGPQHRQCLNVKSNLVYVAELGLFWFKMWSRVWGDVELGLLLVKGYYDDQQESAMHTYATALSSDMAVLSKLIIYALV